MIGLCDLCLFCAARAAHLRVARAAAQLRHYVPILPVGYRVDRVVHDAYPPRCPLRYM
jgi:hypothetical protein